MKIAFRVDSSYRIGSGHVMRCLTLADSLRDQSVQILFVCREHDGDMSQIARDRGYKVELLPPVVDQFKAIATNLHSDWLGVALDVDASHTIDRLRQHGPIDWLVVDHYAIDASWEKRVRPCVSNILVIDDLADRSHDCDVLLDQNLNRRQEGMHRGLVGDDCQLLCGPKYALLRPQFLKAEISSRRRDGSINRVLVFFGGVDGTGETLKACHALTSLNDNTILCDVIAGTSNPQRREIEAFCSQHSQLFHHAYVENMAVMMANSDLAIGGGGTTTWERAWLGLPTIIVVVAENQLEGATAMAEVGGAWNTGLHSDVTESTLRNAISHALNNREEVALMSKAAQSIFGEHNSPGVDLVVNTMMERQHARA